jgi:hypothetical protein
VAAKVVPLRPKASVTEDRPPSAGDMREIAKVSSKVIWLRGAREKAKKRGITRRQVEMCLLKGTFIDGPFRNERSDWQVTVQRHAAGEEIKVVVIFKDGDLLVRSNH